MRVKSLSSGKILKISVGHLQRRPRLFRCSLEQLAFFSDSPDAALALLPQAPWSIMSAIGSLVFCTDCGNLLDGSSGDSKVTLVCDVCGASCKGTIPRIPFDVLRVPGRHFFARFSAPHFCRPKITSVFRRASPDLPHLARRQPHSLLSLLFHFATCAALYAHMIA